MPSDQVRLKSDPTTVIHREARLKPRTTAEDCHCRLKPDRTTVIHRKARLKPRTMAEDFLGLQALAAGRAN
jgi:hypothetical protein